MLCRQSRTFIDEPQIFFAVIDAIKMSMTFLFFMSMYNPAKSPPNPEDLRPFPHYVLAYWLAWPHNRMVLENTQFEFM